MAGIYCLGMRPPVTLSSKEQLAFDLRSLFVGHRTHRPDDVTVLTGTTGLLLSLMIVSCNRR